MFGALVRASPTLEASTSCKLINMIDIEIVLNIVL